MIETERIFLDFAIWEIVKKKHQTPMFVRKSTGGPSKYPLKVAIHKTKRQANTPMPQKLNKVNKVFSGGLKKHPEFNHLTSVMMHHFDGIRMN